MKFYKIINNRPFYISDNDFDNEKLMRAIDGNLSLGRQTMLNIDKLDDINTIFDIGANIGALTVRFAELFPTAKIYAFEPTPFLYDILKKNCQSYPNKIPINAALAGKTVDGYVYSYPKHNTNYFNYKYNKNKDCIPVKCYSCYDFIIEHDIKSIDLLYMDINGWETEVLETLTPFFHNIRYLDVECHDLEILVKAYGLLDNTHDVISLKMSHYESMENDIVSYLYFKNKLINYR